MIHVRPCTRVAVVALAVATASCASGSHPAAPTTTAPATSSAMTTTTNATTTTTTTTTTDLTSTTTRPSTTTSTTAVRTTSTTRASTTTSVSPGAALRVWRGSTARPMVALTFDAGSDAGNTVAILDVLAANHIRATFGMTGAWARANPALLRRIVADGHQLLNHTDSHDSFTGYSTHTAALSDAQRTAQIVSAQQTIRALTGVDVRPWFRPPYGDVDAATDVLLARLGYRYDVFWTLDSLGWKGTPAATVVARCLAAAGNGVIYLFHVGSKSTDAAALPAITAGLRARGLSFTTVAGVL